MSDYITGLGVALYDRKHIELVPARQEKRGGGAEHGGEGTDGVERGVLVVTTPQFGQLTLGTATVMTW
ncbi:hypothetical protein BGK70_00780 [Streptomyces agglomeratus]|nr:hypothetical protein BGK70_00780 [Streptomyces agglomeratus]